MEDQPSQDQITTPHPWTKAIPPARDRIQSHILVWSILPILCLLDAIRTIGLSIAVPHLRPYIAESVGASLCFGLLAWRSRAATAAAAASGSAICLCLLYLTNTYAAPIKRSALLPLAALFGLTFIATRTGRARKAIAGLAESRKGRSASQVVANLGFAALQGFPLMFALIYWHWPGINSHEESEILAVVILSALAEAAADTVSSEIGQAFGGRPRLLTTLRRVPPGTDGAVTIVGTLSGIAAAAIIAASGAPALSMSLSECFVAFAAGVLGLFFDSLLGATLEQRGWIGNDLVNFAATAFAATVSLAAVRFFGDSLAGLR